MALIDKSVAVVELPVKGPTKLIEVVTPLTITPVLLAVTPVPTIKSDPVNFKLAESSISPLAPASTTRPDVKSDTLALPATKLVEVVTPVTKTPVLLAVTALPTIILVNVDIPATSKSINVPTVCNYEPTTVGPRVVLFNIELVPALNAPPSSTLKSIEDCNDVDA